MKIPFFYKTIGIFLLAICFLYTPTVSLAYYGAYAAPTIEAIGNYFNFSFPQLESFGIENGSNYTTTIFAPDTTNVRSSQGGDIPSTFIYDTDLSSFGEGYYYIYITNVFSGGWDYTQATYHWVGYWDGVSWSYSLEDEDTTITRFISFTVSTSTQTVNITGYWNATTTPLIYEQLEFYQDSTLLGVESYTTETATTTGNFNFTFPYNQLPSPPTGTTTQPITATQNFYSNIYQFNENYYTNPFSEEQNPLYKILLASTSTELTASTTNGWIMTNPEDILAYPEYECSITSLTGCFKNAMIWLFYPSETTLQRFYALLEVIQRKPPIGYFTIIKNSIGGISATSTPAFSITIPQHIKEYFFTPVDVAFGVIIWVYFIFMFYKRLKHITL